MKKSLLSTDTYWLDATRQRIIEQQALIATLKPGSKAHRMATDLLLLFQDSLHELTETAKFLEILRKMQSR